MEFRLLGPVEVVTHGKSVPIAAPRMKVVLAVLALESNHVVSVSRLIDTIWGDKPPSTAKSQVQMIVSRLRQQLGYDGIFVTQPPGYALQVAADSVDLARFKILAEAGANAAARQRFPEAVTQLRAALGLWRGPAMDGIASELIQAAAYRLNEWRLSVLQDCLDYELRLGRHAELIGEFTGLVAEHPLNERFRAQLMLALYRSGRQADALAVYREGVVVLRNDTGLDPDEKLQRLEQAILTKDPALNLPPTSQPITSHAERMPVPRQLPRTTADFTGREHELRLILGLLSGERETNGAPDVPVIILAGMGGTGKTALALRVSHMSRDKFPDGQLFIRFTEDNRKHPAEQLEHLLRTLGITHDSIPRDPYDRAAMYRSLLADRKVLIVLDNAFTADQIAPYLPGTRGCAVIVTTSQRLTELEGAHSISVGPLDNDSAYSLIEKLAGGERVRAEITAVGELIRLCDGYPLALRIAGAKLAARPHWKIGQLVNQLAREERRLDELDLDGTSVRTTITPAYERLAPDARALFRMLSLLGTGDFAPWVCTPLINANLEEAEELLSQLVAAHLVEHKMAEDNSVRFHMHDLVRIYALECLANEVSSHERMSAVRRLLGCWLYIMAMAHRRIFGGDFGTLHGIAERWPLPDGLSDALIESLNDWYRKERAVLLAAIKMAAQLQLDEICWDLAVTAATWFEIGSYIDDWRDTHGTALQAVRQAGNKRGEASLLYSLGTMELRLHIGTAREYFERSLTIFTQISDGQGRALALAGLAFTTRLCGDYEIALSMYQEAVGIFQMVRDRAGEAHVLKTIAQIHKDWLDYTAAEHFLERSLTICEEIGSPRLTAQTLYELADLYMYQDRTQSALIAFNLAFEQARKNSDMIGQSYALAGLGNAKRRLNDVDSAELDLTTALTLAEHSGDRLINGRILFSLAELVYARDQFARSFAYVQRAIKLLRELGSAAVWHARSLEVLGRLHRNAGRYGEATSAWRAAVDLAGTADPALISRINNELEQLGTVDVTITAIADGDQSACADDCRYLPAEPD